MDTAPKLSQSKLTFSLKSSSGTSTPPKVNSMEKGKVPDTVIKIASWNINGLKAVMSKGNLVYYLNKSNPDILCLSEIKISDAEIERESYLMTLEKLGYLCYYNCCKAKGGYSGTGILTKYKPMCVKYGFGIPKHDQEGRLLTAEFEKFYLLTCYAPNVGGNLNKLDYRTKEWDPDFRQYINELKKKKPVVLCGDLNVAHTEIDLSNPQKNHLQPGFTGQERKGFTELMNTGWIDTFRFLHPKDVKYTWFNNLHNGRMTGKGWRVDYFVVNSEIISAVKESTVDEKTAGSDHCPIEALFDVSKLPMIQT